MAHPSVYVPAIAVGHAFGLILLLYSLEKTFGLFTKIFRRFRRRRLRPEKTPSRKVVLEPKEEGGKVGSIEEEVTDDTASIGSDSSVDEVPGRVPSNHDWDSSADARARAGIVAEPEPHILNPPWVRGCSCQVQVVPYNIASNLLHMRFCGEGVVMPGLCVDFFQAFCINPSF